MVDALALQPNDPACHQVKGMVLSARREWRSAIAEAETAIAEDRQQREGLRRHRLLEHFHRAERGWFRRNRARVPIESARPRRSDRAFPRLLPSPHPRRTGIRRGVLQPLPRRPAERLVPARGLGRRQRLDGAARGEPRRLLRLAKIYPDFTVAAWTREEWSDDPTFKVRWARITEGLRKAGAPET